MADIILKAFNETVFMTFYSTIFSVIFGFILAVILTISGLIRLSIKSLI